MLSMTVIYRRLFLLVLVLLPLLAAGKELHGRVVGVTDGDTLTLLDENLTQYTIRLSGIDAPEKKQAFGQRSKQSLSDLVFGKTVTVETHKQDRYGRLVGMVLVDGVDANLVQVERGMAWFYRRYQGELMPQDRQRYLAAEVQAREQRRGLWRDKDPVPPWDWRKGEGAR